jgi:hypothetical protein
MKGGREGREKGRKEGRKEGSDLGSFASRLHSATPQFPLPQRYISMGFQCYLPFSKQTLPQHKIGKLPSKLIYPSLGKTTA